MKIDKSKPIYNLILSAMFASVMVLCAWITIPTAVPFTLQTLAVFLTAMLLDLKYSLLSVGIYIALGVVGLPVFSGFQGGIGVLIGPTGGYILGFVFIVLIEGICKKRFENSPILEVTALILGLLLCYIFGTLWFMVICNTDFLSALLICVLPYVLFDGLKIALAVFLSRRLRIIM